MGQETPGALSEMRRLFLTTCGMPYAPRGQMCFGWLAIYTDKRLEIMQRRKEVENKTLEARRDYNRTTRGQGHGR